MTSLPTRISTRLHLSFERARNNRQVYRLARQVDAVSPLRERSKMGAQGDLPAPVAFFNASTRLTGISLNAAFSLLASLGLQMAGTPVVRFACQAGMTRCVLGTDRLDPSRQPPCKPCIAQSQWLFSDAPVIPFSTAQDPSLAASLDHLSLEELDGFAVRLPLPAGGSSFPIPLGQLVLPSIRWVLRRHHLQDDQPTRFLYRQYILSASQVAREFTRFLELTRPQAVVLFNGQFFPEATARWVAVHRGIRTITHEVGLLPFSAFFTTGEATAYPLVVPSGFELDDAQNQRLDAYLSQRFHGQFSMAGIRFWPEIEKLPESFLQKAAGFKQIVPVFTNVIFDTSQPHSNVVFPHMFAWLDQVLEIAHLHPDTFFIIRAHPDETRPGKASLESVAGWVADQHADELPNLLFVDATQPFSSYELIQRAKFVMVYNSTIGLEASILGVPVLCAGRARYTQLPTVFFPSSPVEYRQQAEAFLQAGEIDAPLEFQRNARRFLYYQLFRSSLPLGDYLEEDGIWPGFVRLKKFSVRSLTSTTSPAIRAIVNGITSGGDFLLESDF